MIEKVNNLATPEGGENKQQTIATTTTNGIVNAIADIPEEAKVRIKIFLEKM